MSAIAPATGCYAALLAREGFTANAKSAFEHKQGFLDVFNGEGNLRRREDRAAWGKPWDIMEPGIAIKQYPCCGSTHPAIDAMLTLVREHDLMPADVERVDSWTHHAPPRAHEPPEPAERARRQIQRPVPASRAR